MGYLTSVRIDGTRVNMRNDMVSFGRTALDASAIAVELSRDGDTVGKMEAWTAADYDMLEDMINRIFDMGLVRLLFSATNSVVNVLEKNGELDDTFKSLFESMVNSEEYTEYELQEFIQAGYAAIRVFTNHNIIRSDLVNSLEILRVLFYEGMYRDIRNITRDFNDPDELEVAIDGFVERHSAQNYRNVQRLTDTFFNFSLTRALLTYVQVHDIDGTIRKVNIAPLFSIPLAYALRIDQEDVASLSTSAGENTKWTGDESVSSEAARLIANLVESLLGVSQVLNSESEEMTDVLAELNVVPLANALDVLTNSQGTRRFMRAVILRFLPDEQGSLELGEMASLDMNIVIDVLKEQLSPDNAKDIEWLPILNGLRSMAIFTLYARDYDFVIDRENVADLIKNAELILDLISNPIIRPNFVWTEHPSYFFGNDYYEVLNDALNDLVAEESISREFADRLLLLFGLGEE